MNLLQFSSVHLLSRVRLFVTPWITARQASLSITNSQSSLRLTSIEAVMPSSHLILCRPLLLLPPIPPSIRVSSNESTLRMKWPKYWSFSFSIIPSKELPGLISFRMDWLDLLAVQGTLKSLLQHHSSKASIFRCSAFVTVQYLSKMNNGFPGGAVTKDLPANAGDGKRWGFNPWIRQIPWSRKWKSVPVFLLEQRSLLGYSPWGLKELDTTEHMSTCLTRNDNVLYIINLNITIAELSFMFFFLIDHLLGDCTENCICLQRKYWDSTKFSLSHRKAEVARPTVTDQ